MMAGAYKLPSLISLVINRANIKHGHMYLRDGVKFFPADAIGGGNKRDLGIPIKLHVGSSQPVITDIDGVKKIFRSRSWEREFFERHGLREGQKIVVQKVAEREYHVFPAIDSAELNSAKHG